MRSTAITRSHIYATHRPVTPSTTCRRTKCTAPFRKFPEFMEKYLKRTTGSNRLYLASSVTEKTLVANSEERFHSILATLEECRAALIACANRETAQLLSVAILELRMKLHRVADSELKAMCDAMLPDDAPAEGSQHPNSPPRPPFLKLLTSNRAFP